MKKRIWVIVIIVLLLPVWMLLAWAFTPKKKLVVAIVDKTVLSPEGQQHLSLTWILNHQKFTKNQYDLYRAGDDYFGFFPKPDKKYRIKGLERFTSNQVQKLSTDADAMYVTDSYGVYRDEWSDDKKQGEGSALIYGGLSQEDIDLMTQMKEKHKLILSEFNTIASPTRPEIRQQFEKLFSLQWTGWTGKYFESLDTQVNAELPKWVVRDYCKAGRSWPFKTAGIVLVNSEDAVVVLVSNEDLTQAIPKITTVQNDYGVPGSFYYPYWFDIMTTDTSVNHVLAYYQFDLTKKGKKELEQHHIPLSFPAVQMHKGRDYTFAYFSGNFSFNPVSIGTSYFKGVEYFNFLFCNHFDPGDRARFFWQYYRPLVTGILSEYYDNR